MNRGGWSEFFAYHFTQTSSS